MKIADIARIIEAVVFVSGDGVDKDEFKRLYDLSDKELNKCLDILKQKYNEESGINIITYKNKIQFCSNPDLVEKVAEVLNPIRERSLTKSALETIAIIAYKQPITRTEIEQIRGANSDYAMQLLQSNNLIEVVGRKDTVGKPLLFGTTENFLKRFGLENIDSLPNHKELLDRIRVIHSDGDSLYREFDIPDESNNNLETSETTENSTTETIPSTETSETLKQDLKDLNEADDALAQDTNTQTNDVQQSSENVLKSKRSKKQNQVDNVAEDTKSPVEETQSVSKEGQKLSWRDKMKAKMAENVDNYDNLDSVLERKKNG